MSPRRLLVVRTGAMGDVLHALPAVAAVRAAVPDLEVNWVVDPRWAPLLVDESGRGPLVSRVFLAETKQWSRRPLSQATLGSILALRRALRDREFDFIVDVQGTLRSAAIARMVRCSAGVTGFADPREVPARWLYRQRIVRRAEHVVEQNAGLFAAALGQELEPALPALPRSEAAERWAEAALGRFGKGRRVALLAPSAGWAAKQWPGAHFAALARALADRGWAVVLNGRGEGDALAAGIAAASGGAAHVLPSSVAELMALVRLCGVVVGGDSGPVHLAAALGRPVVALFGPTDPARNGPWGKGVRRVLRHPASVTSYRRRAEPDPGLARITPTEVFEAVCAAAGEETSP